MGWVDLHVHLLWGIDDGARTEDDAVAMAELLVSLGFVAAAPSPHHRTEYASADRALCRARREALERILAGRGITLELYDNAENAFSDDAFLAELAAGTLRRVGGGPFVLVEAPYASPLPALDDLVFRMKLKGMTPLIAHPERCREFEARGRARAVVGKGARLQLDVGSLVGKYGKVAQRLAEEFLGEGLYSVAATDMHAPSSRPWLEPALAALSRRAGAGETQTLLATNPRAVLDGVLG